MNLRPLLRALPAIGVITAVAGLFLGPVTPAGAAYPGDNGLIAFERDVGGDKDILTIAPSGGATTNLTDDGAGGPDDFDPSWSADGDLIAFASDRTGSSGDDIWMMDADGSHPVQVTDLSGDQVHPTWSPNGNKIAFEDQDTGGISTVNANGVLNSDYDAITDPDFLTCFLGDFCADQDPSWSPNGDKIAFSRSNLFGIDSIRTMDPDGTGVTAALNFALVDDVNPDWAPDGSKLVYNDSLGLGLMNPNGTLAAPLGATIFFDGNPAYSPDGDQIAYDTIPGQVRKVGANGVGDTQVTADGLDPSWQPINIPGVPGPGPSLNTLTVAKAGTGSGTVTSNLAGINCGADCGENYLPGTTVTLTASPSSGSSFGGWNVAGCPGTGACTLVLNLSTVVTATFNAVAGVVPAQLPDPQCGTVGVICGDAFSNVLTGTPGDDLILGFGGNDHCVGGGGADMIICGAGNDTLIGGPGADSLISYGGSDVFRGGGGSDHISPGAGNDKLYGGSGQDTCTDSAGADTHRSCEKS